MITAQEVLGSAREVLSARNAAKSPAYAALEQVEDSPTSGTPMCSPQERELQLAFARTTIGVTMREEGTCKVEESVYGAAIVMPQLARTVGWDKTMTIFALQSWTFLLLNVFLQAYLLRMLAKEEVVMDAFGGQMFLCDFGADLELCPGPGCRGPGGTDITGPRLYSWNAIVGRNFVKDSLKAIFPDKLREIEELVDVGEYGLESYWCRTMCAFIFMVSCMGELCIIFKMIELIWKVPTKAEPWIHPRPREPGCGPLLGSLDEVRVTIAGIPMPWKILNLVIVVGPKFMLWKLTAETGITILMETAGIDDLITNSVGLTFILGLDELIGSSLMRDETLQFVRACEDFDLFDQRTSCVGDMSLLSEDEMMAKYQESQKSLRGVGFWDMVNLLPMKLLMAVAGTGIFVAEYYLRHCNVNADDNDRMVSRSMYPPKSLHFSWLNAFLPNLFPIERGEEPYWEMPVGPNR